MKTILIVDDDDDMRGGIVEVLTMSGYDVLQSDNGLDALDIISARKPALIISDVMMANMNGFVLCETVRAQPETSDIPMILISGYARDAGAWGADAVVDYLTKPFTFDELISVVERRLQ